MFTLNENEVRKINDWIKGHDQEVMVGAIGGRYTYCFTDTNIGRIVKVIDGVTGENFDATDYDDW